MHNIPTMTTPDYVRTYRKQLGIRQEDLARVFGIARTSVVAIEKGERQLLSDELNELYKLGFPVCNLVDKYRNPGTPDAGNYSWLSEPEKRLVEAFRERDTDTIIIILADMLKL